ncbi:MAG: IS3 family transposase [Candidatus Competibacteraceae bacterium]
MGERMTRDRVMNALTMVVWRRQPPAGQRVHSDRGSQYASNDHQKLLAQHGFLCSMSRKGDGYDKAAMESFFHTLKGEQTEGQRYATREEAKAEVFEYIEAYYNRQRRHSTLNNQSPCHFEVRMAA